MLGKIPWWVWALLGISVVGVAVGCTAHRRARGLAGPIRVDSDSIHGSITNSTRTVLRAHDLSFCTADGARVDAARHEKLLREIGRNSAAPIVMGADEDEE